MEDLIFLLIIIIALIILLIFAMPVILFGVSINVFTIYLCGGVSPFHIWLLSLTSSMFIAGIYSSVLHIMHFKISKVIRELTWIGIVSAICVGLITTYFIPTYISLKTNKELLFVSTNLLDEISKTYYINDTGNDFILYPITCSYYAKKYNVDCKTISFCKNMKLDKNKYLNIRWDNSPPSSETDVPNIKLIYYIISPNTYSKILTEEEQHKRSRIFPCKHVHQHRHRINHADVYDWD